MAVLCAVVLCGSVGAVLCADAAVLCGSVCAVAVVQRSRTAMREKNLDIRR